jgi:hypothetical protein
MIRFLTISVLLLFCTLEGFSQFKVGAGANLIFDGGSLGIGGRGHYTVNEDFAAQGSFHYYLESFSLWNIDLDVHYDGFEIGDLEGFRLTPFAGLNIIGGVGSSVNLNIGIQGLTPLTESLDLYIEPKLIIGSGSSLAIAAGVYF